MFFILSSEFEQNFPYRTFSFLYSEHFPPFWSTSRRSAFNYFFEYHYDYSWITYLSTSAVKTSAEHCSRFGSSHVSNGVGICIADERRVKQQHFFITGKLSIEQNTKETKNNAVSQFQATRRRRPRRPALVDPKFVEGCRTNRCRRSDRLSI